MRKIFLLSISVFSIFLFLATSITKPPVFAETLEGIELRDLDAGGSEGCVYRFEDDPDTTETVEGKGLAESDGFVLTLDCAPILFFNLVFWALFFSGLVALFLVIFGGFKYMTSGGDQKAVESGKKTIMWAIIGLVVVLLSFAVVRFIADITGMECLTRFGFIGTCE